MVINKKLAAALLCNNTNCHGCYKNITLLKFIKIAGTVNLYIS